VPIELIRLIGRFGSVDDRFGDRSQQHGGGLAGRFDIAGEVEDLRPHLVEEPRLARIGALTQTHSSGILLISPVHRRRH
jgi:hypothetical protein